MSLMTEMIRANYFLVTIPTTKAHKSCDTQPTTSLALLRIQLIIPSMIPGNASAALIPNQPSLIAMPML